jgi:chaperonin cofactor prefoldin
VVFHQLVLAFDLLACGLFLRRKFIANDFENKGKRRQIKDKHHHAFDTWRNAKAVCTVAQMVQQISVKAVFPLLLQTQRTVDFRSGFAGHQSTQKLNIGTGNLHVHHEISPCVAEQSLQVVFRVQDGVYRQLISKRFTPRYLRRIHGDIERIVDALGGLFVSSEGQTITDIFAKMSETLDKHTEALEKQNDILDKQNKVLFRLAKVIEDFKK